MIHQKKTYFNTLALKCSQCAALLFLSIINIYADDKSTYAVDLKFEKADIKDLPLSILPRVSAVNIQGLISTDASIISLFASASSINIHGKDIAIGVFNALSCNKNIESLIINDISHGYANEKVPLLQYNTLSFAALKNLVIHVKVVDDVLVESMLGMPHIANLEIYASSCVSHNLGRLLKLSNLQKISVIISGKSAIQNIEAELMSGLDKSKLGYLKLVRCGVTDDFLPLISRHRGLVSIDLAENGIYSQKTIQEMTKLPSLRRLNIVDTNISPKGYEQLQKALPDCILEPPLAGLMSWNSERSL